MLNYVLALLVPLMVLVAGCVTPHTKKVPDEPRQLTMPKAHTEGQPFEVAVFHGCYDGDTCTVSLPPGIPSLFGDHITVRLAGIDTPEMKGICEEGKTLARQAQALAQKLMVHAVKIELLEPRRDKYFRILARVLADGQEVAQERVKAGLARPYDGGKKERWCPS
ncbi:MAG: thermonuclease family protein [Nitrospirales bacterium]